MTSQLKVFLAGSVAGAGVLAAVYFGREGAWGVGKAAVAAGVCIVPGMVALAWVLWSRSQAPSQQLLATMGGMLLRMAGAFAGGLLAYQSIPEFRTSREGTLSFWAAILVMYLWTLALETVLAARSRLPKSGELHR